MDLRKSVQNSNLLASLVIHNTRHDVALGLTVPSQVTSELAWHFHNQRQEAIKEAFSTGVIQHAQKRIKELLELAHNTRSLTKMQEYLDEALALEAMIDNARSS